MTLKVTYGFPIYANSWIDIYKNSENPYETLLGFIDALNTYNPNLGGMAMPGISYAILRYIAAHVFVQGLQAVEGNLTWSSYIHALESIDEISIPMGGTVSFKDGRRWATASMALLKYHQSDKPSLVEVKPTEGISVIQAK